MLSRLTPLALLAPLLAACGTAPTLTEIPSATPPEATGPQLQTALPWTQLETCKMVRLRTEMIDFSAPMDAPPEIVEYSFLAEVPSTPAQMQKGLQGRHPLHPDTAMLFEFAGDHNPVLWMKDTPASLDMVFFDAEGSAFYLEAGTTPNSERFLTPEEPDPIATHVLELPAGRAIDLGLFPGSASLSTGPAQPCLSTGKSIAA